MSRSYDRPTGPPAPLPPPATPQARAREAHYSSPVTAPPDANPDSGPYFADGHSDGADDPRTGTSPRTRQPTARDAGFNAELRADERAPGARSKSRAQAKAAANDSVVPAGSVTSRSLTLVITIMCFLACLTAGCVYMINQQASAWLRDIASEVTLQIEPRERVDTDKTVRDAAAFLARQPGIRAVRPLSTEESAALIEPWLGNADALKALPVPRLIAIEVERGTPADLDALRKLVEGEFKGAKLDDHRHWQQQIRTVTRSLALGGLAILMLVGAATTAIIISATRSSMASNREIVEVLHLVGATDRYIAREFERHFLRLGVRAGLVGAGLATLVFMLTPIGMSTMAGDAATMTEVQRLFGAGGLDMAGYAVLFVVVVVIAGLCMLTSRFGVYRILDTQR